jgi:putative inorganic carbon (HCO3(-)) transporter
LLALLWIGPALWEFWLNPPQETALGTFSTLNYRKDLWPWALAAIEDFPFSGVGLGAFRLVAFRLYPLTIDIGDIGHAHSMFLQTALDLGLPGLVVYLAILLVAAAAGWRVARRDEGLRSISLGLLAGLAAFHIFGLADAVALGAKPAMVFWFALGLLAAMSKRELAAPETEASHSSGAMPQRER